GQPPDWARPEASSGQLRPHPSESGSGRGIDFKQGPGTGVGVESGHVSPPSAGCSTTGRGLGRQGACLDGRANVERDLGAVLAEIRAGIDVDMLYGYAPARLSDGTPLAPTQLAELLCDSDIARVVLTAHGEPIDTSRSQRLFSGRQARAVAARDRSCRYPGCSRGIEVSQIHHAQQWEKGGPTTMDNAVLLCFHHHRYVHSRQIIITHHAGGFTFTDPDGELVGITHHTTILEAA
ncbi:MAG: HNH endonuclease signature motif containing protein, partial [Ancrocorticia sp.]